MNKYQWVPTDTAGAERLLAEKDERISELEDEIEQRVVDEEGYAQLIADHKRAMERISELEGETEMLRFACTKREKRIADLERELKEARAPYVMEAGNEWMRLFGIIWYSEKYHKKITGQAQADAAKFLKERDDARAWAEEVAGPNRTLFPWEGDE